MVFEHEISAFDPDQRVQGIHPGKPDRHGLLLQFGPGRRTARFQVGIARPTRRSQTGRKAGLVVSGGFPQAVRDILIGVQNDLGYQGYAPIGSVDTDYAGRNRESYVQSEHEAAKALVGIRTSSDRGTSDADIRWRTLFPDGCHPDPLRSG
jgi:hypothetical protein